MRQGAPKCGETMIRLRIPLPLFLKTKDLQHDRAQVPAGVGVIGKVLLAKKLAGIIWRWRRGLAGEFENSRVRTDKSTGRNRLIDSRLGILSGCRPVGRSSPLAFGAECIFTSAV